MHPEAKQEHYAVAEKLLSEQNFAAAVIAGAVATVLAAAAYAATIAVWDFSYGFAAAGIGIVIGLAMQFVGRGIETRFGVMAAIYTLAGCVLGNVFGIVISLARTPAETLQDNSPTALAGRVFADFGLADATFWFVAVFCAVFLAKRPLSRSQRLALGMYEMKPTG